MAKLSVAEPLLIMLSLAAGFGLSYIPGSGQIFSGLEEPLLKTLLFFIFLEINFSEFKKALSRSKFLLTAVCMNFLWTPILAFVLSKLFLGGSPALQIALVMMLVMPCTDWYLVFTALTGGNVALSSTLLPINLTLQLLLLPAYLLVFFGTGGTVFEPGLMLEAVAEIAVPIILALLVRWLVFGKMSGTRLVEILAWIEQYAEIALVCLIGCAIFASEGQELLARPLDFPWMFIAIVAFYVINFCLSLAVAKRLGFPREDAVSLVFTCTARNTPLSLSLAGVIFSNEPLIRLALLIGPLTELPFSAVESFLLRWILVIKDVPNNVGGHIHHNHLGGE